MASSSYRPLLKVPVEFSSQFFSGKCPDRVLPLWHGYLHSATLPTRQRVLLHWFQMPSKICHKKKNKNKNMHVSLTEDSEWKRLKLSGKLHLADSFFQSSNKSVFSSKKHNRWMHCGFIILMHSPYGIVAFKLSASDTVQVVQSPVSWTHTGWDQPNTKSVWTAKCYFWIFCSI